MREQFTPYSNERLPNGFRYPERYLRFAHGIGIPAGLIWGFPNDQYGHAANAWRMRLHWKSEGWKYLTDIDPIPFARNGDWAAFFDGNDHSGDPRVVVADLGNKSNSYRLANFDAWLDRALKDSGLK